MPLHIVTLTTFLIEEGDYGDQDDGDDEGVDEEDYASNNCTSHVF